MRREEKGPSQRSLQVGEEIRHILAEAFTRGYFQEPLLEKVPLTVTAAQVSPDLKNATVYVMPLGGSGEDKQHLVALLKKETSKLRYYLGKRLKLRFVPHLKFELDESFDYGHRIDELLRNPRVRRDIESE